MSETLEQVAFREWVKDDLTQPGQTYQYHRGFLVSDREKHPATDDVASAAWDAWDKGRVALVQKRHGDFDYSYLAQFIQVKAKPWKRPAKEGVR